MLESRSQPTSTATDVYPDTEDGWNERYNWLEDAYFGKPYKESDVQALGLFKAMEEQKVLAITRRLCTDFQHIINVDQRALCAGGLSLELAKGGDHLDEGLAVWRRSRLMAHMSDWMLNLCTLGDRYCEAIRGEDGKSRIVSYDARHVTPTYSTDGTRLERVEIKIPYFEDGPIKTAGQAGALNVYTRIVDATSISVRQATAGDATGVVVESQSGEHKVGRIPVVHLRCIPAGAPSHSLSAGYNVIEPMAAIDSMVCQGRAIALRYANPRLAFIGARPGDVADLFKFATALTAPQGGDIKYVMPELGQIVSLWQMVREYQNSVRDTIPEFTAARAGANTSGEALRLWSAQLDLKLRDMRSRVYGALVEVTQMAALMDIGGQWDDDRPWYRIMAPPVLPVDNTGLTTGLRTGAELGDVTRPDRIRAWQALGLLDAEESAEDLASAAALQGGADEVAALLEGVTTGKLAKPSARVLLVRAVGVAADVADELLATVTEPVAAEVDDSLEDDEPTGEPGGGDEASAEKAQDSALNGAQVQSALEIVNKVSLRQIPRDSGVAMLEEFFNIEPTAAEKLMGEVGRTFFAPSPEPTGGGGAQDTDDNPDMSGEPDEEDDDE